LQGRAVQGTARQPRPFLNRNQYGGKFSGPAPLPRFGEGGPALIPGKLFFFGAYEGLRLRRSSSRTRLILTPNARQGLFSFLDSGGTLRTVNLFALPAAPGAGGAPVPTGIDPVVQARIINNMPATGNRSDLGDNLNTTGLGFDQGQATTRNSYTTRLDLDINDRNSINFVYTYKNELNQRPDADNPNGFDLNPIIDQGSKNRLFVLAYRMTPSPNFTNEVRGGVFTSYVPFLRNQDAPGFFIGGAVSPNVPNTAATTSIVNNPEVVFLNQGRSPKVTNLQDNADYLTGNHSIRFGGNYQGFKVDPFNDAGIVPTAYLVVNNNTPQLTNASFAGILPAGTTINATQLTTANRLYALLGGIVGDVRQTFNVTGPNSGFVPNSTALQVWKWENYAFYVSDQWRFRPRLTINLGLRYELQTPLRNANQVLLEPVIQGDPVVAVTNPNGTYNIVGTNAGGTNVYKMDKNNFAPVLSIAWSPNFRNKFLNSLMPGEGRTVLRGGYRISYVNDENVTAPRNALIGNIGLGSTAVQAQQVIGGVSTTQVNARLSAGLPGIVAPTATAQRTYAQNNAIGGNFGTVFGVDPNLKIPYINEYNFSIQRELGFQTALEVRYVGSYSTTLTRV
ncbi:MAG: TonB-dependent receptor, partial [Acidobacteria bacterium]|nr:TonB-dependent receptor [Acidobacteriota bacterium]